MVWKREWEVAVKNGVGEEEGSKLSRIPDVFVQTRKLLLCTGPCQPLGSRAPGRSILDKAAPFKHRLVA